VQHIQHITNKLRQLKKIESSNREHCEGVALKLLIQIKKVLKAYNYSYTCAGGLDDLKVEKKEIENKLKDLEDQYNDMEYDPTFKKIQAYFNQTRSEKEELIQKIQTFDMSTPLPT
jgi:iron-sulfur cluster repair protein YtfE (RIC family)